MTHGFATALRRAEATASRPVATASRPVATDKRRVVEARSRRQ
jgi:hypothetical protein